jgi:hypothetical protein
VNKPFLAALSIVTLSSILAPQAYCIDYTYDAGGSSTFWNAAGNYNPDGLPGVGDTVTIQDAGNYSVNVNIASINLGSGTWTNEPGTTFRIRDGGRSLTASTFTLTGNTGNGNVTSFSLINDAGGAVDGLSNTGNAVASELIFTVNGSTVVGGSDVRFNNSNTSGTNTEGLVLSTTSLTFQPNSGISITGTKPVRLNIASFIGNDNILKLNGGLLTLSGTTNYASLGLLIATIDPTPSYNVFQTNTIKSLTVGTTVVAPGTYTAGELNLLTSSSEFVNGGGTLTVVPEPGSIALLGGAGMLMLLRRRRGGNI